MKLTQDPVIRPDFRISGIESSFSAVSAKYFTALTREVFSSNLGLDIQYSHLVKSISSFLQILGYYLSWTTTGYFQILYYPLFTSHRTIARYVTQDTDNVMK